MALSYSLKEHLQHRKRNVDTSLKNQLQKDTNQTCITSKNILIIFLISTIFIHAFFYLRSNSIFITEIIDETQPHKNTTNHTSNLQNHPKWINNPRIGAIISDSEYLWCKNIFNNYTDAIAKHNDTFLYTNNQFTSQYNQDWFIYTSMARHMDHKGVYIDLAAHTYKTISNTYFFDKCLSWNGICIEAEIAYIPDLNAHRSCDVVHNCIWSEPKNMTFLSRVGQGWYAGWAGLKGVTKRLQKQRDVEVNMTCVTLQSVLDERGIKHVDYMSLDIEGAEMGALKGVDWNRTQIDVMSVERNSDEIVEYLESLGYIVKMKFHGGDSELIIVHENARDKLEWVDQYLREYDRFHDSNSLNSLTTHVNISSQGMR